MDLQNTCRLCMCTDSKCESLLINDGVNIVETLTSIKILTTDKLPTAACSECWGNIKFAYELRESILEADRKLRSVFGTSQIEIKQELTDDLMVDPQIEVIIIKGEECQEENIVPLDEDKQETSLQESDRCSICGKKVPLSKISDHIKEHFFSRQICDCGGEFENVTEYSKHFSQSHSSEPQTYYCKSCPMTFKYKTLFNVHLKMAHVKQPLLRTRSKARPQELRPLEEEDQEEFQLLCKKCKRIFKSEMAYFTHMRVHDSVQCQVCDRYITRDNFSKHVKSHTSGPAICHLCGLSYKNHESLRGHLFHSHSGRSYPCEICGKSFRTKYRLSMHVKKVHTGERNHTCDNCGKTFFTNHHLSKHINSTHLKLRPYICEHCNKKFSSRYALRTHVRQHTDDKPYKCDICGEGFRQNVSLRTHKKSKHNIVEEITCYCPICGKGFSSNAAIISHRRLH